MNMFLMRPMIIKVSTSVIEGWAISLTFQTDALNEYFLFRNAYAHFSFEV